jgi:hypothetical protein
MKCYFFLFLTLIIITNGKLNLSTSNSINKQFFSKCANKCGAVFNDCGCDANCVIRGNCCSDYKICDIIQKRILSNKKEMKNAIQNCRFEYSSYKICFQCNEGFYYHKNSCVEKCPVEAKINEINKICYTNANRNKDRISNLRKNKENLAKTKDVNDQDDFYDDILDDSDLENFISGTFNNSDSNSDSNPNYISESHSNEEGGNNMLAFNGNATINIYKDNNDLKVITKNERNINSYNHKENVIENRGSKNILKGRDIFDADNFIKNLKLGLNSDEDTNDNSIKNIKKQADEIQNTFFNEEDKNIQQIPLNLTHNESEPEVNDTLTQPKNIYVHNNIYVNDNSLSMSNPTNPNIYNITKNTNQIEKNKNTNDYKDKIKEILYDYNPYEKSETLKIKKTLNLNYDNYNEYVNSGNEKHPNANIRNEHNIDTMIVLNHRNKNNDYDNDYDDNLYENKRINPRNNLNKKMKKRIYSPQEIVREFDLDK